MPDPKEQQEFLKLLNGEPRKGVVIDTKTYAPPKLPMVLPLEAEKINGVDDGFGDARGNRPHLATDIYANKGTEIKSASTAKGVVVATGGKETVTPTQREAHTKWSRGGRKGESPKMNYSPGRTVTVQYTTKDGVIFYVDYWHLNSIAVKQGQHVDQNTVIGTVGNSGTTVPHLHMSTYFSKKEEGVMYYGYVNPLYYLKEQFEEAGIKPKYKCRLCEQGKWNHKLDSFIYWYNEKTGRVPPNNPEEHLKNIGIGQKENGQGRLAILY